MPTIKLYANLRNIAGTTEVSITPPSGMLRSVSRESNLGACVSALIEQVPALDGVIVEDGQIKPYIVININGHAATNFDVPVGKDDVIAIFPPMAGG